MKRINVDPWLDAGVQGLIKNMATKNFWRVAYWYELDDIIQDGYMVWTKVRRHYPDITNIRHLTALFRTSYDRYIIDLSKKRTRLEEVAVSQLAAPDSDGTDEMEALLGVQHETTTVTMLMHSAPAELKQLWRFLTSEDGRRRLRERKLVYKNGTRETTNQFLCRVLGLDAESVNLEEMAKQHFFG